MDAEQIEQQVSDQQALCQEWRLVSTRSRSGTAPARDPASMPQRQGVLTAAGSLANNFRNTAHDRVDQCPECARCNSGGSGQSVTNQSFRFLEIAREEIFREARAHSAADSKCARSDSRRARSFNRFACNVGSRLRSRSTFFRYSPICLLSSGSDSAPATPSRKNSPASSSSASTLARCSDVTATNFGLSGASSSRSRRSRSLVSCRVWLEGDIRLSNSTALCLQSLPPLQLHLGRERGDGRLPDICAPLQSKLHAMTASW